jgi:hypothetical protein
MGAVPLGAGGVLAWSTGRLIGTAPGALGLAGVAGGVVPAGALGPVGLAGGVVPAGALGLVGGLVGGVDPAGALGPVGLAGGVAPAGALGFAGLAGGVAPAGLAPPVAGVALDGSTERPMGTAPSAVLAGVGGVLLRVNSSDAKPMGVLHPLNKLGHNCDGSGNTRGGGGNMSIAGIKSGMGGRVSYSVCAYKAIIHYLLNR